jgi:hypothetical protein
MKHIPTKKSPEMEAFITKHVGKSRQEILAEESCAMCKTPNTDFRDVLSLREYHISGMCQNCQDEVFGI